MLGRSQQVVESCARSVQRGCSVPTALFQVYSQAQREKAVKETF